MSNLLYVAVGVSVVLIVLMVMRMYFTERTPLFYKLLVDTPAGLVNYDNKQAADALAAAKKKLLAAKCLASDSCASLKPLLDDSMRNLEQFIKANPRNARDLCTLELRSNIIDQSMQDSVRPGSDYVEQYRTLLDWEDTDNRMMSSNRKIMEHLIKNIDIAIAMLRSDVCDYGRLNLNKLYEILTKLSKWSCIEVDDFPIEHAANVSLMPASIPFMPNSVIIEPMDRLDSMHRETPESFAVHATDFEIPENANNYSELLGEATVRNRAGTYHYTKLGSTLLDDGLEGQVEQDILAQQPIGHSIGQLYATDHFTINTKSCLGKTVSDDELWSQCTQHDMRPKLALDGEPQYMISKLEHSMHV